MAQRRDPVEITSDIGCARLLADERRSGQREATLSSDAAAARPFEITSDIECARPLDQ